MNYDSPLIFVTWAIGPSYRYRLKQFIKYNLKSKSCDDVKYIIFTDSVNDFDYLLDTDADVIEINDIFEFIESRNIELAHNEYLPQNIEYEDWAKTMRSTWGEFSYPAKRIVFKRLYELNINKFVLIDPDVYVNPEITKQELYKYLDIPINTVSVMGNVTVSVDWNEELQGIQLMLPRSMTVDNAFDYVKTSYFLVNSTIKNINKKYNTNIPIKQHNQYQINLSEGIFHFYNFENKEKLLEYYYAQDEAVKLLYASDLRELTAGPGWLRPDFIPLSIANMVCDIAIHESDKIDPSQVEAGGHEPVSLFYGLLFYEDKYPMPSWDGIVPADTMEEYAQLNKDILNKEYLFRLPNPFGWWDFLIDYNIIDKKMCLSLLKNKNYESACKEYYGEAFLNEIRSSNV
jgi:hypothetical protein